MSEARTQHRLQNTPDRGIDWDRQCRIAGWNQQAIADTTVLVLASGVGNWELAELVALGAAAMGCPVVVAEILHGPALTPSGRAHSSLLRELLGNNMPDGDIHFIDSTEAIVPLEPNPERLIVVDTILQPEGYAAAILNATSLGAVSVVCAVPDGHRCVSSQGRRSR